MKIEDMKFPIKLESKDSLCEYNIEFTGGTFFKKCCDSRSITGTIESREIPILVKGFKLKERNSGFGWMGCFRFCPECGEFKSVFDGIKYIKDVILEEWLKIINNKRSRRSRSKTAHEQGSSRPPFKTERRYKN